VHPADGQAALTELGACAPGMPASPASSKPLVRP